MDSISKLLIESSGANHKLLEKCPRHEVNKFIAIGITNITTGVLMAISTGYLTSFLLKSNVLSLLAGSMFGIFIYLVYGVFLSSDKKYENKFIQITNMMPKLLLMMIIAGIISKSFELWVFRDFIISKHRFNTMPELIASLEILSAGVKENSEFLLIRLFIYFLFFSLTAIPFINRSVSPKGVYDFLVEEFEEKINLNNAINEITITSQAEVRKKISSASNDIDKALRDALPSEMNKETLDLLANVQKELKTLEEYYSSFSDGASQTEYFDDIVEIKSLIGNNKTRTAIEKLLEIPKMKKLFYNELITIKATIERTDRDKVIGQISDEKFNLENNKINVTIQHS